MLNSRSEQAVVSQPRSLYVVPQRKVARATHVPLGRALHLIDLENLMGGPRWGPGVIASACQLYRAAAPVHAGDHVLLATNTALAVDAGVIWPEARLLHGTGPNGADLALIWAVHNYDWIASRYDRVVIGSGDGIFSEIARAYRQRGVAVGVIACQGSASQHLLNHADFFRQLPEPAWKVAVA